MFLNLSIKNKESKVFDFRTIWKHIIKAILSELNKTLREQ